VGGRTEARGGQSVGLRGAEGGEAPRGVGDVHRSSSSTKQGTFMVTHKDLVTILVLIGITDKFLIKIPARRRLLNCRCLFYSKSVIVGVFPPNFMGICLVNVGIHK